MFEVVLCLQISEEGACVQVAALSIHLKNQATEVEHDLVILAIEIGSRVEPLIVWVLTQILLEVHHLQRLVIRLETVLEHLVMLQVILPELQSSQ